MSAPWKTWVWSDQHFFHEDIITYHHRPADCDELMVRRAWEIVPEKDVMLVLGDIAHGIDDDGLARWMPRLPGRKYLVPGNHDRPARIAIYLDRGFRVLDPWMAHYRETRVFFTHEPLEVVPPGALNVHGHLHSSPAPTRRHVNVCVEVLAYRPARLDLVLDRALTALEQVTSGEGRGSA